MCTKVSVGIQFCTMSLDGRISMTPTKTPPRLVDLRAAADALKRTHFYKGNVIHDNLRLKYDKNHIPSKVIVPPACKSGARR